MKDERQDKSPPETLIQRGRGRPKGGTRANTLELLYRHSLALLSEQGVEGLSFEEVRKRSGVSRSLIHHYFTDRNGLLHFLFAKVLEKFKTDIDTMIEGPTDPVEVLQAYIQAHFNWVRQNPLESIVVLLFLHHCTTNAEYRALNLKSVASGLNRIERLLRATGRKPPHVAGEARHLQVLLTGALISEITEDPLINGPSPFEILRSSLEKLTTPTEV